MAFKIKEKMVDRFINWMTEGKARLELTGMVGSERAYVAAKVFETLDQTMVVILPDQKQAARFMEDLKFFMPPSSQGILYFPGYHILPYKSLSYHGATAARRLAALYHLSTGIRHHLLVTSVDTLMLRLIPKSTLDQYQELVINGDDVDRDLLVARLNAGGYERTALVEEPGDYSVRGGIMDVFSPNYSQPIRMDLIGDYVESLRFFSPLTQRGTREIEEAVIIPASEAVVPREGLTQLLGRLRVAAAESDIGTNRMRDYVDKTREEGRFPGMESMLSIVYPELSTLLDYVSDAALWVMDQPDAVVAAARDHEKKAQANFENARNEQRLCVSPESVYLSLEDLKAGLKDKMQLVFKTLDVKKADSAQAYQEVADTPDPAVSTCKSQQDNQKTHKTQIPVYHPGFESNALISAELRREGRHEEILKPLVDWLTGHRDRSMAAVVACSSDTQAGRLNSLLQPYGIETVQLDRFHSDATLRPGIYCVIGNLSSGFVFVDHQLALITDQEIFGSTRRVRKSSARRTKARFITPEELKTGDIVVHMEHGLGRYEGLRTISMEGISGDFILITYRDGDRLYLPVDRMEMVEKYVGMEGYSPILDKIGGKTWQKARAKAKKEVEKMAGELLKLYAERRVHKGHAFSPPDSFYSDFEASFPYEETPDQLRAIEEVLTDMEDETPMDRLVCGDVGYGKTEVALRAAFKAVSDGRQVAMVVPTTILAEQHYHTFRRRFAGYPVNVAALSRFRSAGDQKKIVSAAAEGKVDVVIGTHRLLQKDIRFKSLGLLIVDEEQRFGVKHKESLKKSRSTVDVLALTATPIPRTLHLSLTGMRDISVIATPPEDRQPIISYISEFDDSVAADAIKRELSRGGQIFFIHNEIKTIFQMADQIKKLVPHVRLGVAHGRLSESELEKVMIQFINRDIDLLVCTTIVESGLDIPSANTMIINKADRFGLSQIYQLRGRIGRGDEQAYAYLFIPEESRLSRDARKRLAALMEHRDLGSGFQIAMKDLQIRGAGTALGASQSGHIAAVGYDMFLKLLDEAISDLKGKPVTAPLEPEINIPMSAHISDDYVQSIEQRLTIYRRLSQMTETRQVLAMQKELVDRFGKLPEEAVNMLFKIILRILCIKAGIKKMDAALNQVSLVFSDLHRKRPGALADTVSRIALPHTFSSDNVLKVTLGQRNKKITRAMAEIRKILKVLAAENTA